MKKRFLALIVLAGAVLSSGAWADSGSAFSKLKSLSGKWTTIDEKGNAAEVSFEVISDGSALLERAMNMVTVYYPDNDAIMVTHYCSTHTQPRMRATGLSDSVSSLDFNFVDVTNAKAGQGYINHLRIDFKDKNHVVETWSYGTGDKSLGNVVLSLTRE